MQIYDDLIKKYGPFWNGLNSILKIRPLAEAGSRHSGCGGFDAERRAMVEHTDGNPRVKIQKKGNGVRKRTNVILACKLIASVIFL
jgi:hypothetical protein